MNKIFTLALGLLVTSSLSYGQKAPSTPTSFPQQSTLQSTVVVQNIEYNQKTFYLQ